MRIHQSKLAVLSTIFNSPLLLIQRIQPLEENKQIWLLIATEFMEAEFNNDSAAVMPRDMDKITQWSRVLS